MMKTHALRALVLGHFSFCLIFASTSFAQIETMIVQPLAGLQEGESVNLRQPINFYFDSAILRPESLSSLKRIAIWLKANPEVLELTVVTHTETFGSSGYNLKLSRERAKTLRRLILAEGVSVRRVFYQGQGERKPLVTERTVDDKLNNRRVEFVITKILPGLQNQKQTRPQATSKSVFTIEDKNGIRTKKSRNTKLKIGTRIIAGKSKVTIKNGPSTLTLMPGASVRLARSIQDYNIQKKTFTIKPTDQEKAAAKKASQVSPWLLALDNPPVEVKTSKKAGVKRKTIIKRVLRAGIMAFEHISGKVSVKTKNLFDVYILYSGGQIHVYDGTAKVDKNALITLVTNGKDSKTVLFQDEHPTVLKDRQTLLATSVSNQHRVLPLPTDKRRRDTSKKRTIKNPKVVFHYSKTRKGISEQAILEEYDITKAIFQIYKPDHIDIAFPQGHRQDCEHQERQCLYKYGQAHNAEWVVDVAVTKTPRHVRTSYTLLSTDNREFSQQTFHKTKSHNQEAPLRQNAHAANTHPLSKHEQMLIDKGRPFIGADQEKEAVLAMGWNYTPQRYDTFAYSGQKIVLEYLQDHSETIGIEGQYVKALIDEHPDCDLTDTCLQELAGAFGATYILDGDLVQNIESPLENDLELRLYNQQAMLVDNKTTRFKPVNGVLREAHLWPNNFLRSRALKIEAPRALTAGVMALMSAQQPSPLLVA